MKPSLLSVAITSLASLMFVENVQASSFVPISLTDNRNFFSAVFSWDTENDASELLFGIERDDFEQTCPFNDETCWDFSVFFSDNEVTGFDFFVFAQHIVPADDTDDDEGNPLNQRLPDIQSFPGGDFRGLPITGDMSQVLRIQSESHPPEHTDLYTLSYSYPTAEDEITFTLTGLHIPEDIPPIPESSFTLGLLTIGGTVLSASRKKKS